MSGAMVCLFVAHQRQSEQRGEHRVWNCTVLNKNVEEASMRRMKQLKQASGVSGISKEISCCKTLLYGTQLREIVKYKSMIVDIRYYSILFICNIDANEPLQLLHSSVEERAKFTRAISYYYNKKTTKESNQDLIKWR